LFLAVGEIFLWQRDLMKSSFKDGAGKSLRYQ
jgi:hypothetical protein